jgi:hypothetical protein
MKIESLDVAPSWPEGNWQNTVDLVGTAASDIVGDIRRSFARLAGPDLISTMCAPILGPATAAKLGLHVAFPHLVGLISPPRTNQATDQQADERCVFPMAACHTLYQALEGAHLEAAREYSVEQCCYRDEGGYGDPFRLRSFRMAELVFVGRDIDADQWFSRRCEDGLLVFEALGLPVVTETATDPFFGVAGNLVRSRQRAARVKQEFVYKTSDGESVALGSVNLHGDRFGRAFDIRMTSGEACATSCIGIGIERVVLALADRRRAERQPSR